MKKILFIITCLSSIAYADNLSVAIRNNNLQVVTELLEQKTMTSADFTVYISASNESIQLAREHLVIERLKPTIKSGYILGGLMSYLAGLIISGAFLVNNHEYVATFLLLSSFATAITMTGIGCAKYTNPYQEQYDNALQIQELILNAYNA